MFILPFNFYPHDINIVIFLPLLMFFFTIFPLPFHFERAYFSCFYLCAFPTFLYNLFNGQKVVHYFENHQESHSVFTEDTQNRCQHKPRFVCLF